MTQANVHWWALLRIPDFDIMGSSCRPLLWLMRSQPPTDRYEDELRSPSMY